MPLIKDALARLLPPRAVPAPDALKASATGPLIAFQSQGAPVWSARDYAAFSREGFMQNAIVYRCVRMIAEAAASVPLIVYSGDRELDAHPLIDLLARPAPGQTGTDLMEAWYGYLLVSGNAYLEVVTLDDAPRELHALRPDRMTILPGASGWPEAFEYAAGGSKVRFPAQALTAGGLSPILHVRLFHPLDDHYGMSPIEAASVAIDTHNAASRWNKALLDNAARPSGALVYAAREGRLSPEQFDRLKNELQEGFQGAKNAGRPLLLEGGLDWKPLSLTPAELDYVQAKNGAAREIALALGVPPMLLAIPGDNTYSNYAEAQRAFWRNTVLPLVARTTKALSAWLSPAYDATLIVTPNLDEVDALAPEREALWSRLDKATFLTTNEKRAAAGYGPAPPSPLIKYNPNHDDLGRFTFGDADDDDDDEDDEDDDDEDEDDDDEDEDEDAPQADPSEWPTWDNPGLVPVTRPKPPKPPAPATPATPPKEPGPPASKPNEPVKPPSPPKWLSPDASAKVPKEWGPGEPNNKGADKGWRWFDPAGEKYGGIRIDPANPSSRFPFQQSDHVVVRKGGQVIGRDGNPLPGDGSLTANPELGPIPLSEWLKWRTPFSPK